jgi:hypothetical protein
VDSLDPCRYDVYLFRQKGFLVQRSQLEKFKEWTTRYISGFYTADDDFLNLNIQLKECHTHRVCNEMRQLSESLSMDNNGSLVAETIALFHDIGRFRQFQKYRTYKDAISENHCLVALDVLNEHKLLFDLPQDEQRIIQQAIEFHGVKELPALSERSLHFAKMIRDADKIDIFELLTKNYRLLADDPENFPWEIEYPDTPQWNPQIIRAVLHRELIHYDQIKTINDAKLLQLGWVYDIYFDYSLKQIYERGHLQSIIDLLPSTDEIRQVADCVLSYVRGRIQLNGSIY